MIYLLKNKNKCKIWPRGIPLDELFKNKIKIDKKKKKNSFIYNKVLQKLILM